MKTCALDCTLSFIYFYFRCDKTEHGPKYYDSFDDCTYIFEWKTPIACPQIDSEAKGCTVKDDYFGHTFNLSGLHKKEQDYRVKDFAVNVCGELNKSGCKTGASICQNKDTLGRLHCI